MKVGDLIKYLRQFDPEKIVYFEGGDFKGDWREVQSAHLESNFHQSGLLLKDTKSTSEIV